MNDVLPTPRPKTDRLLLVCDICKRRGPIAMGDVERFARAGWPRCCGYQMWCTADRMPPKLALG